MSTRKLFRERAIGERFHLGKHRGMGARSHVTNCEVLVKESNVRAVVVEVIGDNNTKPGAGRRLHWMAATFDV